MRLWTFQDGKLVEGIAILDLQDGRRAFIPTRETAKRGETWLRYLLISRDEPPEIKGSLVHVASLGWFVPEQETEEDAHPDQFWYTLRRGTDTGDHFVAFPWASFPKFDVNTEGTTDSYVWSDRHEDDILPAPPPTHLWNSVPAVILLVVGLEDALKVFPYGRDDRERAWVLSNSHHGVLKVIPLKEWERHEPRRAPHPEDDDEPDHPDEGERL